MTTIKDALKIISEQPVELKTELRELSTCRGFSLSQDIFASFDMPSFDNSAMDGYALCGISGEYRIVGEVAAGDVRTMTLGNVLVFMEAEKEVKKGDSVICFLI